MAQIPIAYNLRSLVVRKTTTLATALGIALVVFVFSSALMLGEGIKRTLARSGSPDIAVVMSKGADTELSSNVNVPNIGLITASREVKHAGGLPNSVGEIVGVLAMEKVGGEGVSNVQIRGVPENVWAFRPSAHIVAGRKASPGSEEAVIGASIRGRFLNVDLGKTVEIRKNRTIKIVGVFEDGGSSFESEIWGDIDTVRSAFGREGLVSSVRVQLTSAAAFKSFKKSLESNRQLEVDVWSDPDYYAHQSNDLATFITGLGFAIAFFFSIGAMIGAMITMYAAVSNRSREIGALRALGFSKSAILFSFLLESILLALGGGLVGALASLATGFIRFSVLNFASWSEIVFTFDPTPNIIISAIIFAGAMGLLGGLFPAIRAARTNILTALR